MLERDCLQIERLNHSSLLLEDGNEKGREGYQRGGQGNHEAGDDVTLLLLDDTGLNIQDVVLLHIEIRRIHDVSVAEVEHVDLTLAIGILTNELDTVADAIDGEVASLGKGLVDVNLLTGNLNGAWRANLTKYRDGIVGLTTVTIRRSLSAI